jgi:hypothetical protein
MSKSGIEFMGKTGDTRRESSFSRDQHEHGISLLRTPGGRGADHARAGAGRGGQLRACEARVS